MTSNIYALKDPRTGEIRYIGQSIDPEQRFKQHLSYEDGTPKANWIRDLRELGLVPKLVILEANLPVPVALEAEKRWIKRGIAKGWPLTNSTAGGDGPNRQDLIRVAVGFTPGQWQRIVNVAKRQRRKPQVQAAVSLGERLTQIDE